MKGINKALFVLTLLYTTTIMVVPVQCINDDSKVTSAKRCLKSYGNLTAYNLKHLESQKNFANIFSIREKIEKLTPENSEEKKALFEEIKSTVDNMKTHKVVVEYLEEIKEHCNPEDSHLLEKLNIEASQEFEEKEEEKELNMKEGRRLHYSPGQVVVHELKKVKKIKKIRKICKLKNVPTIAAAGVSIALTAVPALVLLPICLIPAVLSSIIGIAGFLFGAFWGLNYAESGDGAFHIFFQLLSLAVPLVVNMICFAPALIIGSPLLLATYGVNKISKKISKKLQHF